MSAPKRLLAALTICIDDEDRPERAGELIAAPMRELAALLKSAERDAQKETSISDPKDGFRRTRAIAEARFGKGPLPINPATGKRFVNTGRAPTTGAYSPILEDRGDTPQPNSERRFRTRRERAAELQERMTRFSAIYNAGWILRDAYFGPSARRHDAVMRFIAVLLSELRATQDYEACVYAMVDTLMSSPLGVPWEP